MTDSANRHCLSPASAGLSLVPSSKLAVPIFWRCRAPAFELVGPSELVAAERYANWYSAQSSHLPLRHFIAFKRAFKQCPAGLMKHDDAFRIAKARRGD